MTPSRRAAISLACLLRLMRIGDNRLNRNLTPVTWITQNGVGQFFFDQGPAGAVANKHAIIAAVDRAFWALRQQCFAQSSLLMLKLTDLLSDGTKRVCQFAKVDGYLIMSHAVEVAQFSELSVKTGPVR